MPDFRRRTREIPAERAAWVPDTVGAGIVIAIGVALLLFLRVFLRVRERLGIGPEGRLLLSGGILLIELYLARRAWIQLHRAHRLWRDRRHRSIS